MHLEQEREQNPLAHESGQSRPGLQTADMPADRRQLWLAQRRLLGKPELICQVGLGRQAVGEQGVRDPEAQAGLLRLRDGEQDGGPRRATGGISEEGGEPLRIRLAIQAAAEQRADEERIRRGVRPMARGEFRTGRDPVRQRGQGGAAAQSPHSVAQSVGIGTRASPTR